MYNFHNFAYCISRCVCFIVELRRMCVKIGINKQRVSKCAFFLNVCLMYFDLPLFYHETVSLPNAVCNNFTK